MIKLTPIDRARDQLTPSGTATNSMKKHNYAVEKLTTALSVLASHPGDARERLGAAFLVFHTLSEKDFPAGLQARWRWVLEQINKLGPVLDHKGTVLQGSAEHTMRRIRKQTASKIIKEIYELYWEISQNERYL